jgi:hypothetical protein
MIDPLYLEGVFQIANLFLSITAIILSIMLFGQYHTRELRPFKYLMVALILFDIELIFGALRSFRIYENAFITHVLPGFILGILMLAIYMEIRIRGEAKSR